MVPLRLRRGGRGRGQRFRSYHIEGGHGGFADFFVTILRGVFHGSGDDNPALGQGVFERESQVARSAFKPARVGRAGGQRHGTRLAIPLAVPLRSAVRVVSKAGLHPLAAIPQGELGDLAVG